MEQKRSMDYTIVAIVILLMLVGLVMIYSSSSYKGGLFYGDQMYWLKKQAIFSLVGVGCMFLVATKDYRMFRSRQSLFYIYYIASFILLCIPLLSSAITNGSKRWISLGMIRFQPSEIAKLALILMLAEYINTHNKQMREFKGILKAFAFCVPLILLVGIENLSTCIIMLAITASMIFVSTPKYRPFLLMGLLAFCGLTILLLAASYRMERITTWLDPEHSEKGLQTMQGLYAIGSGGLFGKGLGQSIQKMGFVPEAHNDMVFSILCEELGLLGAVGVLILFFMLLGRFVKLVFCAADLYGSMIVIGIFTHLAIQIFINVGVVTNTIPNTGIPLPFISYGGTSLVFLMVEMGFVLSISRFAR